MAKQTKKQKQESRSQVAPRESGSILEELIDVLYDEADHVRSKVNFRSDHLESEVGCDSQHPVIDRNRDRAYALDALAYMLEEMRATDLKTLDSRWLLYRLMRTTKWVADTIYKIERPQVKDAECTVQVTGPEGHGVEFQVKRANVSSCFD